VNLAPDRKGEAGDATFGFAFCGRGLDQAIAEREAMATEGMRMFEMQKRTSERCSGAGSTKCTVTSIQNNTPYARHFPPRVILI
jgi:hypothetical protein